MNIDVWEGQERHKRLEMGIVFPSEVEEIEREPEAFIEKIDIQAKTTGVLLDPSPESEEVESLGEHEGELESRRLGGGDVFPDDRIASRTGRPCKHGHLLSRPAGIINELDQVVLVSLRLKPELHVGLERAR